ncbi:ribonuclease H-like domain-containing protein [Tanacetum coccineum]
MITWRTRLNIENPDTTEENHEVEVHLIAKVWANIVKTRVSGQEGGTWFEVPSLNEDVMYRSLDQSNPLHLHVNDSYGTPLISIKLTGVENDRIWASAIILALQTKSKMEFINGTCLRTDYASSNLLLEQWDSCNVVLKDTYDRVDGSIVFNLSDDNNRRGHTIDKCFEIIGYPPGFKRNLNLKPASNFYNNQSNNANARGTFMGNNDTNTSTGTMYFTNEQYDNSAVSNQILVRYASGKKSYKLYSLENRSVLYYRDVKFYETVFPMKMSNNESASESNEISSLNFFEHFESELATNTPKLRPNDDEEGTPGRDGSVHQPVHGAISDQPGYDEQHSTTPVCEQNHFD